MGKPRPGQMSLFDAPATRVPDRVDADVERYRPPHRPHRDPVATCAACYEPIRWAEIHSSGSKMPFDPEPTATGDWLLEGKLAYRRTGAEHPGTERYTPHWATCPSAARFRGRKPKKPPSPWGAWRLRRSVQGAA